MICFVRKEFERITEGLSDALGFTRTIGLGWENTPYEKGGSRGVLDEVDFYTRYDSHPIKELNLEDVEFDRGTSVTKA